MYLPKRLSWTLDHTHSLEDLRLIKVHSTCRGFKSYKYQPLFHQKSGFRGESLQGDTLRYSPMPIGLRVFQTKIQSRFFMIFIHHGTGIEGALPDLLEGYTLVKPPYERLNKDELRDLVHNYSQQWPHNNPCLVAGALDDVDRGEVLDILLKCIEEPISNAPHLILWARDYGSVPPTIRSRCGEKYYYTPQVYSPLKEDANRLLRSVVAKDVLGIVSVLKVHSKLNLSALISAYLDEIVDESYINSLYDSELRYLAQKKVSSVRVFDYFMQGLMK